MAIGPVLACAGVWNICRPSLNGLIVDGGAMILTGAFNGLAWMWIEDARASSLGKAALAGLFQIVWGVRRLASYTTARVAANDRDAIARLEAIVQERPIRPLRPSECLRCHRASPPRHGCTSCAEALANATSEHFRVCRGRLLATIGYEP